MAFLEAMHTPHDDLMIAARVDVLRTAFKARHEIRQDRHTVKPLAAIEVRELVVSSLGESIAEFFLLPCEDMYGEAIDRGKYIVAH